MKKLGKKKRLLRKGVKCIYFQSKISEYIDTEVNREDQKAVERHLKVCKDCRREYETLILSLQIIKRLKESELPDG
jgi:predicted anti-sigma-YlaC factor YlaD